MHGLLGRLPVLRSLADEFKALFQTGPVLRFRQHVRDTERAFLDASVSFFRAAGDLMARFGRNLAVRGKKPRQIAALGLHRPDRP